MRLDLGCGPVPREGYEGVDLVEGPGVRWIGDLEKFPWNLAYVYPDRVALPPQFIPDDSVEGACSHHLVEHIRDLVGFMRELHRVCKAGAQVEISHPYQFNVRAWQDPTHVRCLNEVSWFYFDKEWRGGTENTWGGYGDTDFKLVELDAIPYDEQWKEVMEKDPAAFERSARNLINVISDLRVVLECRK